MKREQRDRRFTPARRARFLAVLEATGNVTAAAEEIGMNKQTLHRRRKRDAALARDWTAALAGAERRLGGEGAGEMADDQGGHAFEVLRRTRGGRLQMAAARKGKWTARGEAAFLDALRGSGNVEGSCRAVGISSSMVWARRRRWPAFKRAWEEALDDACAVLEFRLAVLGDDVVPSESAEGEGEAPPPAAQPPFDPEFALKFLKWREEKKAGGGRRGRGDHVPREPTIEEIKAGILKKIEAIERHRKREQGRGGSGDVAP